MTNEQFLKLSEILIGVATSLNRFSGALAAVAEVIHAEKVDPPQQDHGQMMKSGARRFALVPPPSEDNA